MRSQEKALKKRQLLQKTKMKKFTLLILLLCLFSCLTDAVDKTKVPQISKNVIESKQNNVFIKEYTSNNPNLFIEVWSEELWKLDSLGNIIKLNRKNIYFNTKSEIGIARDSITCSWCSHCGSSGSSDLEFIFSKISEEEALKDSLSFYFFDTKDDKCLGKFTFKVIKDNKL